jgi:hypothetical protein
MIIGQTRVPGLEWRVAETSSHLCLRVAFSLIGSIYAKHSPMILAAAWPASGNTACALRNVIRDWPLCEWPTPADRDRLGGLPL